MSLTWLVFRASILTPWLGYLCWSDAKRRRLPNVLTLGGLAAGLCAQAGFNGIGGLADGICAAGVAVLFLLVPVLIRAAGAGDLKMLAAAGAFLGLRMMPLYLMAVSLSGIFVLAGLVLASPFARARMVHLLRCAFDWRYDRKAGAEALPPKEDERMRVPFGIAIAIGTWLALSVEAYFLMGRQ